MIRSAAEPYGLLAQAVVRQAALDYFGAIRELSTSPRRSEALRRKADAEQFFRSEWFGTLIGSDHDAVSRAVKEHPLPEPHAPCVTLIPFLYGYLKEVKGE